DPPPPAWDQRLSRGIPRALRHPCRGDDGRRRDDVSRIPDQAQDPAEAGASEEGGHQVKLIALATSQPVSSRQSSGSLWCRLVTCGRLSIGLADRSRKLVIPALLFTMSAAAQQPQDFSKVEVHILPVQGNVYMLVGSGGNITVQKGNDGVFMVDTMYAPLA